MLVREMFDRVISETGQFILDSSNIEIDLPKFIRLINSVLGVYNKYSPHSVTFNLNAQGVEKFEFRTDFVHPRTQVLLGIPEFISSAVPIRSRSNLSPYFQNSGIGRLPGSMFNVGSVDLVDKDPTPFTYRKPILYFPYPGLFDVKAQFNHKVTGSSSESEILTLSEADNFFFDLLIGKFLISLGRNRRAFTLQPLELTSDADSLVSEGQSTFDDAKQNLIDNYHSFYDAWD